MVLKNHPITLLNPFEDARELLYYFLNWQIKNQMFNPEFTMQKTKKRRVDMGSFSL